MKYELYSRLCEEAKNYSDPDQYVAERGWQEWMDDYVVDDDASNVSAILFYVYDLAHGGIKDNRQAAGYSNRTKFSVLYKIPSTTVQQWEYATRSITNYDKCLIDYTFFISFLMDRGILDVVKK